MREIIEIRGVSLVKSEIQCVGEFTTIQTGSLSCDWCFGFIVFLKGGNSIEIKLEESNNDEKKIALNKYNEYKKQLMY